MRLRRALSMLLTSLAVVGAIAITNPSPASADAVGRLGTIQNPVLPYCITTYAPLGPINCFDIPELRWDMRIVARVNGEPRYSIRSNYTGECLVAFASNGRPGLYTCNSNWADQVWAFQYVRQEGSSPAYWLRNKHSGKCLAMNPGYDPVVFMTTCGNYRDQLWFAPF